MHKHVHIYTERERDTYIYRYRYTVHLQSIPPCIPFRRERQALMGLRCKSDREHRPHRSKRKAWTGLVWLSSPQKLLKIGSFASSVAPLLGTLQKSWKHWRPHAAGFSPFPTLNSAPLKRSCRRRLPWSGACGPPEIWSHGRWRSISCMTATVWRDAVWVCW